MTAPGGEWVTVHGPGGGVRQDWVPNLQPPSPDGHLGLWHVVNDQAEPRWEWHPGPNPDPPEGTEEKRQQALDEEARRAVASAAAGRPFPVLGARLSGDWKWGGTTLWYWLPRNQPQPPSGHPDGDWIWAAPAPGETGQWWWVPIGTPPAEAIRSWV